MKTISLATTLLAAAAAERIAALRSAYLADIEAKRKLMLERLTAPQDSTPELRAVLAEVRDGIAITLREQDDYPEVSVPIGIIRQAVAAGVMQPQRKSISDRSYVTVGSCYQVYINGFSSWNAFGLDEYKPYATWCEWRTAIKDIKDSGLPLA